MVFLKLVVVKYSISGVLIQERARSFFSKLYPDTDSECFKGSTELLTKFSQLMKWLDEAAKIRLDSMKQSTLFSCFKHQNNVHLLWL